MIGVGPLEKDKTRQAVFSGETEHSRENGREIKRKRLSGAKSEADCLGYFNWFCPNY